MSGHSKRAIAKHEKTMVDAKRGKLFAYLIKNIGVAAHTGDGDPVGNPILFDTIQKTKRNSVPADNITRIVKHSPGTEAGGINHETIMYEGHGLGGVTSYVGCLTNNRNRTASDIRLVFTHLGGFMIDPDSMAFLFSRYDIAKVVATEGVGENSIMKTVLEVGTEEAEDLGGGFVIESDPSDIVEVRKALQTAGIDYDSVEVQFVVTAGVGLDLEGAVKVQHLADAFEDSDDMQNIYHNMMVSDKIRAQLGEEK